jgi:hypothetical protein
MATWWTLTFEGEPTEADFERVSEMTAQGFTSGQLINEPGTEDEEGPATGYHEPEREWWTTDERLAHERHAGFGDLATHPDCRLCAAEARAQRERQQP